MALDIKILNPYLPGGSRPSDTTVDLVVVHSTAGEEAGPNSADNAIATLKERGLSYHYIITKDGTVIKCLPVSKKAYHAGSSYGPHEAAQGVSAVQDHDQNFVAQTSVNSYSIGISLVNTDSGRDPYPEAQIQACTELIQELVKAGLTLKYLTTHAEVAPIRKIDPNLFDAKGLADKVGLSYWRYA